MEGLIYFKDGKLIANSGDVSVYSMNNELFLELGPGHNLWALESEYHDYITQMWDMPKGCCLEIGLGLGVASRCILSNPNVRSLTTVEKNKDVIMVQEKVSAVLDDGSRAHKWQYSKDRHRIVNQDGLIYLYETKRKYDFVFIDCYSHIDDETLPQIKDMVYASKKILAKDGIILCWFDKYTPNEYVQGFFDLFDSYIPKASKELRR